MANDPKIIKLVKILKNDQNLRNLFRVNLMTRDIEYSRKSPWGNGGTLMNNDLIQIKYYIAYTHCDEFSVPLIDEGVWIVAGLNAYNPLLDWLKSLSWDGVSRLDTWLCELVSASDNQYVRDVARKVLCGAVKRIFEPGCKFDYMMILEGPQGVGKSTLINILGDKWYLDTHLSTNENKKDIVDAIRTAWIVEISDLAGFRKNDIEHLKSFISDQSDRVRMPYARKSDDYPRQCIFIGTHNPSGDNDYLKDDTGNRRFWPVDCGSIDLAKAKEWRDQLFAEAVVKYKEGECMFIDHVESIKILEGMHKSREIVTPFDDLIAAYLVGKQMAQNKEIIEKAFNVIAGKLSYSEMRSKQTVIGKYMRKIGWRKGENNERGWYFSPDYVGSEEWDG